MDYIYHYTTEQAMRDILNDGKLKVSEWEKRNNVKPAALWLSTNNIWENTATKMVQKPNGRILQLSKEEQSEQFGLIRFVLNFDKEKLCSWGKYRYKSNTNQQTYFNMEKVGISQGSNPKEWYASFKDIPLQDVIRIEKWDGVQWMKI